jgi:hypothetical protein
VHTNVDTQALEGDQFFVSVASLCLIPPVSYRERVTSEMLPTLKTLLRYFAPSVCATRCGLCRGRNYTGLVESIEANDPKSCSRSHGDKQRRQARLTHSPATPDE